ncbi:MAG: metalloregulator ArsR/SmtB family transcription factor [Verrucomicrobiae bacterium]|nr:metalloregulator ArsR/SmtB family transcription factor [Verrucomicrobiae bacterium]
MREFMKIAKALADANRVRVALALKNGELCVCQISALLGLAPSTISKHLSILHNAGLIESRKTERWVYYRLPGKEAKPSVRGALEWVRRSLGESSGAKEDRDKLKRILEVEPSVICRRQMRKEFSS